MFRLLISLVVALALLAGADYLAWNWATQQMLVGYAAWVAGSRVQGWTVSSSEPQTGGWPAAARITVGDVFVSGGQADIPGGLAWSADRVVLGVDFFHPHVLTVAPEGRQRLRLADLPDIPYTADRLTVSLPMQADIPARSADLAADNLRAGLPASGTAGSSGLTVGSLTLHLQWPPTAQPKEAALTAGLRAEDIDLPAAQPPAQAWPLGPRIASLGLDGALEGPLSLTGGLASGAAAWRDAGGTVAVQRFTLRYGPLGLSASATLALDASMQPMGAGTARAVGLAETLDALAKSGAITAGAATAAHAVLALMTHAPEGGGPAEVEVPLTLQDRTLAMGRIPLARMPELVWPAGP